MIKAEPTPTTIGIATTAVEPNLSLISINIPTAIPAVTIVLIKSLFQHQHILKFCIIRNNPTGYEAGPCNNHHRHWFEAEL